MNCDAAWSATGLLQSGTYTALPIRFLIFFQWFHMMIALRVSKNAELLWTAYVLVSIVYSFDIAIQTWGLFTWACATWILAAASIRERQLFRLACPEVRRQFESGVWSSKYGNRKCTKRCYCILGYSALASRWECKHCHMSMHTYIHVGFDWQNMGTLRFCLCHFNTVVHVQQGMNLSWLANSCHQTLQTDSKT